MAVRKEYDPVPKSFSVIYESASLTHVVRRVIEGQRAVGKPIKVGLTSSSNLDGLFLDTETTTLAIDRASTTINSTIALGHIRENSSYGYFSSEQANRVQKSLRARNIDSDQIVTERGKTTLYLPRKSDQFVYAQIDLGYPSLESLFTHLKRGEFGKIRLNPEEKSRRQEVFRQDGDWGNKEISMQLKMKNRWILFNQHAGPAIFNFYFSRYEAFIRSLYEVVGLPLPHSPILIEPLTKDLGTED